MTEQDSGTESRDELEPGDLTGKAVENLDAPDAPGASGALDAPDAPGAPEALEQDAQKLIEIALKHSFTIGTAESCTGGLVAAALTSIPGASQVYKGSVISYSNEVKCALLDVDDGTLSQDGAVSEGVVLQMAEGARKALKVDFAVSISGVAGPDGGSASKPVGTVWIGTAGINGKAARRYQFSGTRAQIRWAATRTALQNLLAFIQTAFR